MLIIMLSTFPQNTRADVVINNYIVTGCPGADSRVGLG